MLDLIFYGDQKIRSSTGYIVTKYCQHIDRLSATMTWSQDIKKRGLGLGPRSLVFLSKPLVFR